MRRSSLLLSLLLACSCRAGGCAANVFGDVVGATGDAYCDRRFTHKPIRASFCQEIVDTIADGEFQEDCDDKLESNTGEGLCPRDNVLGGCKIHKENDDGSEIFDWYYDVTAMEAEGIRFETPARTKEDVQKLCADPKRYEEGASYLDP